MRELLKRDVAAPVVSLIFFQSLTIMAMNAFGNAPDEVSNSYGIPASFTGIFTAICYLSALTFGLFVSAPLERFGAVRCCQVTLLIGALGMTLFTLATPWSFLISAVMVGFAHGPMNPAGSFLIMRQATPRWRPLLFSLKQTSIPIGGTLAGFLVPTLLIFTSWQTAMLIIAAAMTFAAFITRPFRDQIPRRHNNNSTGQKENTWEPIQIVFQKGPIRELSLAAFILIGCQACVVSFLVIYLVKEIKLELQWAGFIFGLAHGTSIIARIYLGILADRVIKTKTILGLCGVTTGICFFLLAAFPAEGSFWLLCFLGIFLGNANLGWVGLYFGEVSKLAPDGKAAQVTAGSQIYAFGSFVLIPPIFTLFIEHTNSYATGFFIVGIAGLVAGIRFLSIKY